MTIAIKTKSGVTKQYSTVAERLVALHESGKSLEVIESAPVQVGNGWLWRVLIKVDGCTYVGNAEVHLNSTNFAEKADPWATAETSAVGRAIAWCGYAGTPDNPSIASADEVIRAQAKQPTNGHKPLANGARLNAIFDSGKGKAMWKNRRTMIEKLSEILEMPITDANVAELTDDLLELVEAEIENTTQF